MKIDIVVAGCVLNRAIARTDCAWNVAAAIRSVVNVNHDERLLRLEGVSAQPADQFFGSSPVRRHWQAAARPNASSAGGIARARPLQAKKEPTAQGIEVAGRG